jgi:hypothetical protein
MKRSMLTTVLSIGLVFLGACSNGDSKNSSDSQVFETQASFSYELKEQNACGGLCDDFTKTNDCVTRQNFKNKDEFCAGLQDAALNKSCALKARRDLYRQRCGKKFTEVNIPPFSQSLDDERIGACNFYVRGGDSKTYCSDLKSENQWKYCGWDQRRIEYKRYGCTGEFSEIPVELGIKFEGIEGLSPESGTLHYVSDSHTTFPVIRKTFRVLPGKSTRLWVRNISLQENNCAVYGKAHLHGIMIRSGENQFTSELQVGIETPYITQNVQYDIQIQAENDGLCKDLKFEYDISLTDDIPY